MRAAHLCSRCKQVAAVEGDLWCSGCSAWESIGRELAASWDQSGCRVVATDLALNCARQIRALRSLGAGLSRATTGPIAQQLLHRNIGNHWNENVTLLLPLQRTS